MNYFTTVPVIYGKGLNIWLGLPLFWLIVFQITTGLLVHRGHYKLFMFHKVNAAIISIIILIHAYYGFGIWFLGFRYG